MKLYILVPYTTVPRNPRQTKECPLTPPPLRDTTLQTRSPLNNGLLANRHTLALMFNSWFTSIAVLSPGFKYHSWTFQF